MTSLAHGNAPLKAVNTDFRENNRGFQAANIEGDVYAAFHHHYTPEPPPKPLCTVPFRRDPDYVQRTSLLEEIDLKLSQPAARVALVGLGGVGKSQLAIEYAYQLRRRSPQTWVLWVYASNVARFEQSVRDNLEQLKVRGRKDPKENVFQLLHSWLIDAENGPWLIILDNADDVHVILETPSIGEGARIDTTSAQHTKALLDYLPQCEHGKILVTSRTKDVAKELVYPKYIVAVKPMNEEQALALLRKKLDVWYTEQHARRLTQELDFMPLALTQAAAYICQSYGRCSIQQYMVKLGECDKSEVGVLDVDERDLRRDREASNSIMLTWQISFNHIRRMHPSAAELLSLMSFFDRQAIPEALLQDGISRQAYDSVDGSEERCIGSTVVDDEDRRSAGVDVSSDDHACSKVGQADKFDKDLAVLCHYSMVSFTTQATDLQMHRLVQLATKRWLELNDRLEYWMSRFVNILNDKFPTSEYENWAACQKLFPHAAATLKIDVTGQVAILQQASLLLRSGDYASITGAYGDAEIMENRSFISRTTLLGEMHADTLASMNNLAVTYSRYGRWSKAEDMQVDVIEKRKTVLGKGHPDTLVSMNNLALTYLRQGRWDEAEKLQLEVIAERKKLCGEAHPSTLTSINNLAMTYSRRGQWEKAEQLQVDLVAKRREIFGLSHPDTLTSMKDLASTYSDLGQYGFAENLGSEVLEKSKEVLGQDHPDTLASMNNLARTYSCLGRWEDAEQLQEEAAQKRKIVLGEGHPDTLESLNNLALMYSERGRLEKSEQLQLETMNQSKEILGQYHPDTLASINNLALTYLRQGFWNEAAKLQESVVEKSKEVLGKWHPDTLTHTNNLAEMYSQGRRWREAEKLQDEVMLRSKDVLGANHPDTLRSMNNLALIYSQQGQWQKAEEMQLEVMEKCEVAHGREHAHTLASVNNLALTYFKRGFLEKSKELQTEAMKTCKRVLGETHPDTLTMMFNLAKTSLALRQWKESEELQMEVLKQRREVLGEEHPDTLTSMNNLASTYSDEGRWEEAEELGVEVLEKRKVVLGEGHPDTLTSMVNLASTLRSTGRRQSALNLMSSCAEMSQARLGIDHPDTISVFSRRALWEAGDTRDKSSDASCFNPSDCTKKGEDDGDDDDSREAGGGQTHKVATPVSVESLDSSLLDSAENSSVWNHPQFLWMM